MDNVDEKTSVASTICLNCIFADYNSNNVQTGCKANRLELFEKHGCEIKDTELNDKTCFVIEGKTCVYYRNSNWGKKFYKTDDIDIIKDKVRQKYQFDFWRTQRIQATDQIDNDIIDLAYDNTKNTTNYMFYIVFECSISIPNEMSKDIHKSLHDDMKSFVVLLPNNQGVGKGALKVAHQKYTGNSFTIPLEDKIVHYDDAPHLIKKVEEICPSLQQS